MAAFLIFIIGSAGAEESHTQSAIKHTEKAVNSNRRGNVSETVEHTKTAEEQAAAADKDKSGTGKVVSTGHPKNRHGKNTGKKTETTK